MDLKERKSLRVGNTAVAIMLMIATAAAMADGIEVDTTPDPLAIVPFDSDPNPFEFTGIDNVMPGVTVTSAPVTLAGFDISLPIIVENGDMDIGCDGSIDFSNTNDSLYVDAGTSVCLQHVAATSYGATVTTTLHVGAASSSFTTTTQTVASGYVNPEGGGAFGPIAVLLILLFRRKYRNISLR